MNKSWRRIGVGMLLTFALAGCGLQQEQHLEKISGPVDLASPDGHVHVQFTTDAAGKLSYQVTLNGTPVVEPSPLGIVIDGENLGDSAHLLDKSSYAVDDSYPTRAVHSIATDRCNGAKIDIASGGKRWQLDARAYDSGIAFRYYVPGSGKHTPDDATTFTLPADSTVWVESVRGHYEGVPVKQKIAEVKPQTFAAPPLTVEIPDGDHSAFAAITEAAVYDFPGAALESTGNRRFAVRLAPRVPPSFPFTLRYGQEGVARITKPVPIDGPITTPWRVVMVGSDLNTLVNSDILTNLNPPPDKKLFPQGQNTAWIKPGRAVWNYLDGGRDSSPEGAKEFAQLGSLLHFQYNVIEGYWSRWSDEQIRDVCAYSKKRGIGVWVWLMSDPAHEIRRRPTSRPATRKATASRPAPSEENAGEGGLPPWPAMGRARGSGEESVVKQPNRDLRDRATRRKLFAHLHELGVAGVKIDFIDTEAQEAEVFYQQTLEDAAEYHLLVNFHGSAKPTGEQRTYPNELTREAIFGLEHRVLPKGTSAAEIHTVLPFTRFLAGSGDYTPVIFGPRRGDTTWTHQVATAIVFTSALQTYAAHPGNILATPAADMIASIPAVWDETRVLPGSEIDKVAAYARRSGNRWFIGVVNGEEPRDLKIDLSFLGDGTYAAQLLHDVSGNSADINVATVAMTHENSITLHLVAGGGFVARFTPQ